MTALDVSLLLIGWIVAFLATVGARALRDFSKHELEEACRAGNRPERLAEILRNHEPVALGARILNLNSSVQVLAELSLAELSLAELYLLLLRVV